MLAVLHCLLALSNRYISYFLGMHVSAEQYCTALLPNVAYPKVLEPSAWRALCLMDFFSCQIVDIKRYTCVLRWLCPREFTPLSQVAACPASPSGRTVC
jgi:hypothetical protein